MTDEPTIQPAMTPQQWATLLGGPGLVYLPDGGGDLYLDTDGTLCVGPSGQDAWLTAAGRAMVAAACLYGQPFGFTPEDVALLGRAIDLLRGEVVDALPDSDSDVQRATQLRAKIAALLPPTAP